MDIFAHTLSGVLLGRIAAPDDTPAEWKYYLTICVGASLIPDVDTVSYLFGPDAFAAVHQRYTHTIFALMIIPPLAAFVVRHIYKKHSWLRIYLLFFIGMMIHIC